MPLLFCTVASAQDRHEISVYAGGGLSALKYDTKVGERKDGVGGLSGLGYSYFFSEVFGLGTGVEFGLYNSQYNLDSRLLTYKATDISGNSFEFRSTVNYEERHRMTLLQVPITARFQFGGSGPGSGSEPGPGSGSGADCGHKFYFTTGLKFGYPMVTKTTAADANLTNSGYYEYED